MLYIVHKFYLLLSVVSRYFGHLVGARLVLFHHLVALSYSRIVTAAFPFTPSGNEMATKILAWGIYPSPLALQRLNKYKNYLLSQQ